MRPTTEVFLGYRNIGDSKDKGTILPAAPLKEQLLSLVQYLGGVSIATRIQIGVARTESECRRCIEPETRKASKSSLTSELDAALAAMGMTESEIEELSESTDSSWTPPQLGQ